jgi:hypothetical protein
MILRSLLITDLLPESDGPDRRGMLRGALWLGAGLGFSGSSGLGSVGVLRVNMNGPRGSVALLREEVIATPRSW